MQEINVSELLSKTRNDLSGKWGTPILAMLVYFIVIAIIGIIPIAGGIANLLIGGSFSIGLAIFSMNFVDNREVTVNQIFDGFKYDFWKAFVAYLLIAIFTFLWMLLLIVPGIIAAIRYSQTFYLLAEDKSLDSMQAIDKSMAIMEGHKMEYFLMCLAFLGLGILCIFTLGIGLLWLMPYMKVCAANFYRKLVPAEVVVDYGEGKEHMLPQL